MELFQKLFHVSLIVFILGNLLEMGLQTRFREVGNALLNSRFIMMSLVSGFIIGPAIASLTINLLPLAAPYALGLLFLSLAPCAPTLPTMVHKIQGDAHSAIAFMLLAGIGIIIFMPFAVPLFAEGSYKVDIWRVARPALLLVTLPLAIGWSVRLSSEQFSEKLLAFIKPLILLSTFPVVGFSIIFFGRDFLGLVGTYAIAAQILFLTLTVLCTYALNFWMKHPSRNVLLLGTCTRNIGAALVPLYSIADGNFDPRIATMCMLNIPISTACSAILTKLLVNAETDYGSFPKPKSAQLTMKR